ncbi:MAG: porphobilinogen synthase [Pseudomonadota bacterium]|nr:porphobilinogen synthase [Pseudomonadota bacterium]
MNPASSGLFPVRRMRRLRQTDPLRALVRETRLTADDLIYPLFMEEGLAERTPVASMPGIFRETETSLLTAVKNAQAAGIRAVMLFGVSRKKDVTGSDSFRKGGILDRMVRSVKGACPDITVIVDCCFCEYTDHGHCGVLTPEGHVDNDLTLENLCRQALVAAEAGADMIAPSGMMDGTVAVLRRVLDQEGFSHLPVMSYSTKFASAFYGPFREAAGCSLGKGNRRTYQMDPANGREAIRESLLDEAEGADILMVKPGMVYLDVLARLRDRTDLPLAVYQVSGEYAMIRFAAQAGAISEKDIIMESLLAFKRAGADLILTYFAPEAARYLREG